MSKPKFLRVLFGAVVVAVLVAGVAHAGSSEAEAVVEKITSAKPVENVDYSFLGIKYDDAENVLYYAVADGAHFEHTVEVVYRVPIADIADITMVDSADQTIKGGKQQAMEPADGGTSEGDWARISQGCTIKLVAKGPKFAWAELTEDQVKDGKLVVEFESITSEPVDYANLGFFHCPKAREIQHDLHELRKQVKKGM